MDYHWLVVHTKKYILENTQYYEMDYYHWLVVTRKSTYLKIHNNL